MEVSLRVPERANAACQADIDAFVYQFARHYFEVCRAAFKKAARESSGETNLDLPF